jgi:hypothetical protein
VISHHTYKLRKDTNRVFFNIVKYRLLAPTLEAAIDRERSMIIVKGDDKTQDVTSYEMDPPIVRII